MTYGGMTEATHLLINFQLFKPFYQYLPTLGTSMDLIITVSECLKL